MSTVIRNQPLRAIADRSLLAHVALVVLGAWVIAMAARINVPMIPVPMSMQTFAVLLIATLSGRAIALQIVGAYLLQGVIGLPMFVGGAGVAYLAGTTGGYLVGFFIAAGFVGWLSDRGWNKPFGRLMLSVLAGHALIFLGGVLWLQGFIGWSEAVASGVLPFIPGMVAKTLMVVAIVSKMPLQAQR